MLLHVDSAPEKYDGTQLAPLRNYFKKNLLGSSLSVFRGPCEVSFEHMVDGEDLKQGQQICGSDMVHFIFEIFEGDLLAAVFLQRLCASIVQSYVYSKTQGKFFLVRKGDDLYWDSKKFSISIAAPSVQSRLVHFAVNVSNEGTPVPTCSLQDFGLNVESFMTEVGESICNEYQDSLNATYKVRSV